MSAGEHNKIVAKTIVAVVAMFGFGFALVPLYDVFCDITGLNGKTAGPYSAESAALQEVDQNRQVRVQFITHNNEDMPWEFKPEIFELKVHPGQLTSVEFIARNPTSKSMTAQAVPSVSPSRGASYFHKTECFCFQQQTLAAGEQVSMPLRFVVDEALPGELKTLTLSYTLFDQTEAVSKEGGEQQLTSQNVSSSDSSG